MSVLVKTKTGRVYKIIGITEETKDMLYIGSTFQELEDRYSKHYSTRPGIMPKMMRIYGKDSFEIELIKEYKCIDKPQLLALEQLYMNRYKNRIINQYDAVRFHKKEKRKEVEKRYREKNKEKNKEKYKENYEKNKEKIKEDKRRYYEKNKEKIKEIVTCINCGCKLTFNNMPRHKKSIKCQKYKYLVPII